jgi:tetratricopeptide (TPR) repeat protein
MLLRRRSTPFIYLPIAVIVVLLAAGMTTPVRAADIWSDCKEAQDPERGIRSCTQILARGSAVPQRDRAMAHFNRGNAWAAKRDFDRGIADYDTALQLNPLLVDAYYNRGNLWFYKNDMNRAIADYDAALSLNPNYASVYQNRGSIQLSKGELDRAMADLDAALRLNPANPNGYVNRGTIWLARRDFDRAEQDFTAALHLNPNIAEAHALRGEALTRKGEFGLAGADYDAAIRLAPTDRNYNNRASFHRKKGELDRAIVDIEKALELSPQNPFSLTTRAEILRDQGELSRALADVEQAVNLEGPPANSFGARVNAAQIAATHADILQRLGRSEAALAAYDAALALDPNDPDVRKQRTALATAAAAGALAPVATAASPAESPPSGVTANAQPSGLVTTNPGVRIALVIGNASYAAVEQLANPKADAAMIGRALRNAGFNTYVVNDLTHAGMIQALNDFSDRAAAADWAIVYFAGHGLEIGGTNYLVPVDAHLKADRDVQDEAVPLDRVIGAIERAKTLRLIVLDACRNNPFAATMQRTIASRSIGRGLAAIEPEGGTLVAYSAKYGHVALDGMGANSPFAMALVKRLDTPGLEIGKLFRLVRDDVLVATNRQQEPFVYGSLPADDLFVIPPK